MNISEPCTPITNSKRYFVRQTSSLNKDSKPSLALQSDQISFTSLSKLWASIFTKKSNNVVRMLEDKELKKLSAFKQLQDFLKKNNFTLLFDDSRKKYNAKPYYFVEIPNIGWLDNKACGRGNTIDGVISNLITCMAQYKKQGLELTETWGTKKFKCPDFSEDDLKKLNEFLKAEFESFRDK